MVASHRLRQHFRLHMTRTTIYYNCVNFWGGWGFCDLYDSTTGEVCELKRTTCSRYAAEEQLKRYTSGRLKYYPDLSLKTGGSLISKRVYFSLPTPQGTYEITYYQGENGILWYDYHVNRSDAQSAAKAQEILTYSLISISGGGGGKGGGHREDKAIIVYIDRIAA